MKLRCMKQGQPRGIGLSTHTTQMRGREVRVQVLLLPSAVEDLPSLLLQWSYILTLPLSRCVNLGKLPDLSELSSQVI